MMLGTFLTSSCDEKTDVKSDRLNHVITGTPLKYAVNKKEGRKSKSTRMSSKQPAGISNMKRKKYNEDEGGKS